MKKLLDHVVEGDSVNHQLEVTVRDEPGQGGAAHNYVISYKNAKEETVVNTLIHFQQGPIAEFGVNGVTHESLLAILIDRLRDFQAGPFPSPYNAKALVYLQRALAALQTRTSERIFRGVEGKTKA